MGKFENSLSGGKHAALNAIVGHYTGVSKVWFGPELADESPVAGNFTAVLGGRFLLHQYKGSFQGNPLEGLQLIGYDFNTAEYQIAWVDSFHMSTGILFSKSAAAAEDCNVLGTYSTGGDAPQFWGWRTVLEISDDKVLFTSYNISPEGEEEKATELSYARSH